MVDKALEHPHQAAGWGEMLRNISVILGIVAFMALIVISVVIALAG